MGEDRTAAEDLLCRVVLEGIYQFDKEGFKMSNSEFFGLNKQFIIGMVHGLPLPGTPKFDGDMKRIREQAVIRCYYA